MLHTDPVRKSDVALAETAPTPALAKTFHNMLVCVCVCVWMCGCVCVWMCGCAYVDVIYMSAFICVHT